MSERRSDEIYVDGLEGILLGYPVTKLRFTSTDPHSTGSQPTQMPRLTVAIPTLVLLQACNAILNTMRQKQGLISDALNAQQANFLTMLNVESSSPEEPSKSK